ncbi:hypothetical protein HanRHA438_Chr16g0781701 [Helianthus annuus]|nr:hypothetical protein HanRHA438_Chr16g0781701 [Helianthus annuus]
MRVFLSLGPLMIRIIIYNLQILNINIIRPCKFLNMKIIPWGPPKAFSLIGKYDRDW